MRLKDIRKDTQALTKTVWVIIIVVLLLTSSVLAAVTLFSGEEKTVVSGSIVKVDYIGTVNIDGVDYVFDTSMSDVAFDNDTYPKAVWFTARTAANYKAFSFVVGRGSVVTGFDNGVIGMKEGETKTIVITADQGYGQMVASKLTTFNIDDSVPVYVNTTLTAFKSMFGVSAVTGLTINHTTYNWPVTVLSVDSDANKVVYRNVPAQGASYHVYGGIYTSKWYGWNITVNSVDTTVNGGSGLITFHHDISNSSSWKVMGYRGSTSFILINVDEDAGTAVLNFNDELVGQTMTFTVTVNDIQ